MKSNGHDASTSKVNGHGPVSPSRTAQETEAPIEQGRAASDDARDFPTAAAAYSAPAGKERDACAEVAPPSECGTKRGRKKRKKPAGRGTPHVPSEGDAQKNDRKNTRKDKDDQVDIPPGSQPLPGDGAGFMEAMHEHVDIYLACARLVKSGDQKIAQRMVERLFLRWLHRRMRNDEIVRAFVRDIATNHLPHIYAALHAIARKQGIDASEPPMVRFVEFQGHRRHD